MGFQHIPFTYFNIPDEQEITSFLELLDDASSHPVFVHCLHGVDRTGFMIAVFRIRRMNWTFEEAYSEMRELGFHTFRLPHFKWALAKYANQAKATEKKEDRSITA